MQTELAEQNLLDAKAALDELGVPFFLSNGTLLGYYRENGLIKHDRDVDIGVKIEDFDDRIIDKFISCGFNLKTVNGEKDNGLEYSFRKRDIGLDIFFYYDTPNTSWMAVWMHHNNERFRYVYPLISGYKVVEFLGQKFRIPENTEEYLVAQYGEHWQSPLDRWDCFRSPENIDTDYWGSFYKYPHTLEPSSFALSLDLHGKTVIDIGCGNGRDTYYFSKSNEVVGVDQYAPEYGPFKRERLEDYIKADHRADVLYCRFLLHAVDQELEEHILRWGKYNAKNVYIECRSSLGVVPDKTHPRRLINSRDLLQRCLEYGYRPTYFAEDTGFAKTESEDPVIIRLHLAS